MDRPGFPLSGHSAPEPVFHVKRFWEKPGLWIARTLVNKGCLWNTFVLVGHAQMFLDLVLRRGSGDV